MNATLERLCEQIASANQIRYGRSTEKLSEIEGQINLFGLLNEAEAVVESSPDSEEPVVEQMITRRKKVRGKREADLKDLPVEVIQHVMSEKQLWETFPDGKWKELPDEIYRRLAYQPAVYKVEEHHVKVYAGSDNQTILRADRPKDLLRNSIVTSSLEAAILNEKYVKAVPLYRQEQEHKRNGIPISRQAMANWTIQCAEKYLAVLYDFLHEKLYDFHVLHADETPVYVTKDGRHAGSKSYMWVYRTGKMYEDQKIVLYEYQKTRKADHPREFLKDFSGVLVTDGYQAYHTLAGERKDLNVAGGGWSHARRKFADAVKAVDKKTAKKTVAYAALKRIALIYAADKMLDGLSPEERVKKRNIQVKPLVDGFFAWLKEYRSAVPAKTKTGNGFRYCLNQEEYLRYFLQDGEVPPDNNTAEQAIRPFCIGKKTG